MWVAGLAWVNRDAAVQAFILPILSILSAAWPQLLFTEVTKSVARMGEPLRRCSGFHPANPVCRGILSHLEQKGFKRNAINPVIEQHLGLIDTWNVRQRPLDAS